MPHLRILMISYTSFLQKFYQSLPYEIAKSSNAQIKVLVPPYWIELWSKGKKYLEKSDKNNFDLETGRIFYPGNLHFSFFLTRLSSLIRLFKPHIIDMDNEPFNAGSFQISLYRKKYAPESQLVLHASQHVYKKYPPPFNYFESFNLREANAILVRNKMAYDVLKRKGYQGVLAHVTHGVDTTAFKPGACLKNNLKTADNNLPIIGYVGSLVHHKGIDLLLNSVEGIKCRVILIGEGDQKEYLKQLSQKLKLDVTFISSLSHSDIAAYLNCFDIFVLPSRTRKNWVEKFGRVLIEAMACECAVIGSTCGEIPNVIGNAGIIFNENDTKDLKLKISDLIANPRKRKELGQKARVRVLENYSWGKIASSTLNIYKHLLYEKPGTYTDI
jgi:glycosyltransferase involved in cell wall biosynthesis